MIKKLLESDKLKKAILLSYLWLPAYLGMVFIAVFMFRQDYCWDTYFGNTATGIISVVSLIICTCHVACVFLSGLLFLIQLFAERGKTWEQYLLSLLPFGFPIFILFALCSGQPDRMAEFFLTPVSMVAGWLQELQIYF